MQFVSDGEKKSTADILSLFSTAQPAPPLIAPGGFTAFGLQVDLWNLFRELIWCEPQSPISNIN